MLRIKKKETGGEVYWIFYWILSHIPMKNKITISFSFFLCVVYLNVLINAICIWVHKKTWNSFIQANTYIYICVCKNMIIVKRCITFLRTDINYSLSIARMPLFHFWLRLTIYFWFTTTQEICPKKLHRSLFFNIHTLTVSNSMLFDLKKKEKTTLEEIFLKTSTRDSAL